MITYDESHDLKILCLKKLGLGVALYFSPLIIPVLWAAGGWTGPFGSLIGAMLMLGLRFSSYFMWASATVNLAQSKRQSSWWGLLGLVPIIGQLIVLCLPDRSREMTYTVNRLA